MSRKKQKQREEETTIYRSLTTKEEREQYIADRIAVSREKYQARKDLMALKLEQKAKGFEFVKADLDTFYGAGSE